MTTTIDSIDFKALADAIRHWGSELGFQQLGISDTDLNQAEGRLQRWLDLGFHGEMGYMAEHGLKRSRPELLVPGTRRVLSVRMNFLPDGDAPQAALENPQQAFVSPHAPGRDYHKL